MTKQQFLNKFESEKLNIGEYILILEKISDAPLVMGCAFDKGMWKIYKTKERGGHYIIKETESENEAFDFFYELVLSAHNRLNN
ncbi:hypothetical protein [Halobacillus naozhouensis]|uniref:Uncharacterized protein n=1 Tax=Halobacillus naozhouensis TaxID=554880 RepID=A0ABY8IWZ8_9BACI|nr:hypothetical protein [Halobacillus naozhouensis]WFT74281.1 hypothetical protein P9989_18270 [Halobacillus naozhouensis]